MVGTNTNRFAAPFYDYIAELDQDVIAFCTVGPCRDPDVDRRSGELFAIYVSPQSMNKGVGSLLLVEGLAFLKSQRFERAALWVLASNSKTRTWYENRGWVADGEKKIESVNDVELQEVCYVIDL